MKRCSLRFLLFFSLVTFSGAYAQPGITVNPPILNFGPVLVDSSRTLGLTVGNQGNSALVITGLAVVTGNAEQFALVDPPFLPLIIPAGAAPETLTVQFTPSTTGNKASLLRLISNDPVRDTLSVLLRGSGVQPDIEVSPPALDFGAVAIGADSLLPLTISNSGDGDLIISQLNIGGADAALFTLPGAPSLPLVIPPGGAPASLSVQFRPLSPGLKNALLEVRSNDPDEDPLIIDLAGEGVGPVISATPQALNFGNVLVNFDSTLTVEIANTGNRSLILDGATIIGANRLLFSLINPPAFPVSIAPGAPPLMLTVRFAPTSTGQKSAFLVLTGNDPQHNPFNIPLSGTGVQPDIDVNPTALNFGTVAVGNDSVRSVSVTNVGVGPLIITDVSVVGPSASEFVPFNLPPLPITIAPGAGPVTLDVQFVPAGRGVKAAFLSIVSNDPDENPFFVGLSAVATEADIVASPASLDFARVRVGRDSTLVTVLRNSGDADLVISSLSFGGSNPQEFSLVSPPLLPAVIPVGNDSLPLRVRFAPTAVANVSASLLIESNDPDANPLSVGLSGEGVLPDIAAQPQALDFREVVVGRDSLLSIQLINQGGATLTVSDTAISGVNADQFQLLEIPALPFTIPPDGGSLELTMRFAPLSPGPKFASLDIFSDDPDENPLQVSLTGIGTQAGIAVLPPAADFGNVRVNTVAGLSLEIINTGTATLVVNDTAISGPDAGEFRLAAFPPLPLLVPPGSEPITFLVEFHPQSLGDRSAVLQLASNDPNFPTLSVALSGRGEEPDIFAEPPALNFGEVIVGEDSLLTLSLANSGGVPLTVSAAEFIDLVPGRFSFAIPPAFPLVIAPGDSSSLSVGFTPQEEGPADARIEFLNDDPDEQPFVVELSGTGVLPKIVVTTDSLDFGVVALEQQFVATFEIANTGSGRLRITNILRGGANPEQFALLSPQVFPVDIPVNGEALTVRVAFRPDSIGRQSANLQVLSNDPNSPNKLVQLHGRAVRGPRISSVLPELFNFAQDFPLSLTVTPGDTTIEAVILRYGSNAERELPFTLQLAPAGDSLYSGVLPANRITTQGLKMLVEVRDNFPTVSVSDTLYPRVNIPLGALNHTFSNSLLNRWQMFSLPFRATNSAILNVLSSLGSEGDFSWKIYRTDPSGLNTSYFDLNELNSMGRYGRFEPGNAFWLYLRNDRDGRVPTTTLQLPALQTLPGDSVSVRLQPGWNQFGSPYDFDMTWNQVTSPDKDSLRIYRWNGQAWDQLLNKVGWTPLVGGNFTLIPWEGYALFNALSDSVELTFRPGLPDSSAVTMLARGDAAGEWRLALILENENTFDVDVIGMKQTATEGRDPLDFPRPPAVQPDQITGYFAHPQWAGPERYSSDFRPLNADGASWYLTVDSPRRGGQLRFAGLESLPGGFQVALYDRKYRQRLEVGETPVELRDLGAGEDDRFLLLVGTPEFIGGALLGVPVMTPSDYALLPNYPNPFNPSTLIRFQTSVSGRVKLEVFDILGRRVVTLLNSDRPAGFHVVEWDGRSENGAAAASGLYFYRLQVNQFSAVGKMLKLQ